MGLKDIPRTVVGGYLKVARAPIDATLKLAGHGKRGEAVVDRADAAARDLAGTALGDEELRREAARSTTASPRLPWPASFSVASIGARATFR